MADKQRNYPPGTYTGLGIAIGTSIGFMASLLVFHNPTIVTGAGFVLGLIFGNSLEQKTKEHEYIVRFFLIPQKPSKKVGAR